MRRWAYEFPEKVVEEAKSIKEEISKKDIPNRLDLRCEEIFTIDGEDAKDLDDAVQVKKLKNGNYELGVHIADVSYYVTEGSNLDKEALLRGTSIYMLDRVIPMLPRELSNGICSLNEGKDRLCLSVIMEINKEGQVISSDIKKTIINVTRRMNYSDVAILLKYANKEMKAIFKEFEKYEFDTFIDKLNEKSDLEAKVRKIKRFFISGAQEAELDKQGRILVPAVLREHASLEKDVVFAGVGGHIEIWDKNKWEEISAYDDINDIAEELSAFGISF